ncbi:zinc finger protein [Saccharopolyspora flava]|uniref:Zinc-finger n=1 Tax=Saccharopolyspora flava TaxID=95161 RepID=A0A1I6QVH6_9PSEU|nr:zinc finger protein [Saccharopolyspora flava]SFS56288.1 zinc-finger [Saccharopolyspora flava]
MTQHLTHIWRPVPGGRHAFPASALRNSLDDQVKSHCGEEVQAARLHDATEIDWIMEPTCNTCWKILKEG